MAFFGNDAVNRVNLHYGVVSFAAGAGGVFYITFLIHAGLSVAEALAAFAVTVAARFAFRPLILAPAKRFGLKPMVIFGVLVNAVEYVLLGQVRGLDVWLVALVAVSAVGQATYWPCYHAYFAALGDAEHRGHQIGAREALAALVGIVAPIVGAWAILTIGPGWAFGGVALAQALSALPLLGVPNVPVAREAPGAYVAARRGIALFACDGWLGATTYFVWQAVLFVTLGDSLAAYGGAMALAALAGAVIGLFFGRHIDKGNGRGAVLLAYGFTTLIVLVRVVSPGIPWLAVAANVAQALINALVMPAMMTAMYNMAKASPCPMRFHIATDGGWDVGCTAGMVLAAAFAALGLPLGFAILTALPGCAAVTWLLWRYYGDHPEAGGVEIEALMPGDPP